MEPLPVAISSSWAALGGSALLPLLLPGDGCSGFVLWKSWGDAETIGSSRLNSGIRKEESNDRSGRQLQGQNLSQKQFKMHGEQFGCWFGKGCPGHPTMPCHHISEGSASVKPGHLFNHWDKDLGQFIFQAVGFKTLGPGPEEGNEAGAQHGGWLSRGIFCRHHVRLARACNRHGATATKHIPTASWTSTRHPKVKSYLHAWEKTGGDADGPNKPLQETKYTW